MTEAPRNIVLLKGHSAGVGDLLRSSAAWRALHDRYPGVRLHLAFLTQEPGYSSEEFISRHHLLQSFHVFPKWSDGWAGWRRGTNWFFGVIQQTKADWVIDFETNGVRTSLLTWLARRRCGVQTLGVAEVPGRGLFYQRGAPNRAHYARQTGQTLPLNYAERDFVALAALGVARNGRPIELQETPEAVALRKGLRERWNIPADVPLVGLNLGCGTPGALDRRPDLALSRALLAWLQQTQRCAVVLSGAPFERAVNEELLAGYTPPAGLPVVNTAGQTRLIELAGLIRACDLYISADSGPYHLAVALQVPTVVVINFINTEAEHAHPWVRTVLAPSLTELPRAQAAVQDLRLAYPWSKGIATT